MSTHPQELKAEDRNDMARGTGLEGGPATLQKFSQEDVGQGSTRERETGVKQQPTAFSKQAMSGRTGQAQGWGQEPVPYSLGSLTAHSES